MSRIQRQQPNTTTAREAATSHTNVLFEDAAREVGEVAADLRRPEVLNTLNMRELAALIHLADDILSLDMALSGRRERVAKVNRQSMLDRALDKEFKYQAHLNRKLKRQAAPVVAS